MANSVNQFGFVSDKSFNTFSEKIDIQNSILAGILEVQGGSVIPKSLKQVQAIVRAGIASKVFHIGDQLMCNKGDTKLVWDIIGIDHDVPADKQFAHSMTLQLHDCIANMQYDGIEALFYCETELTAGTYHFTLLPEYDTTYGGGKTYQFTLAQLVPAGGQIMFPWGYNTQAASTKVSTYASRTATAAIESVSVTEGTAGTSLGTADGNTANMNHTHRIRYGSNNWAESAMRQWLNSGKEAGSVWTPKTKFDRPPSWATNTAGFLNGIDADFLEVIGETEKITCRNKVTDGDGFDITTDKFFLLSRREVYAGDEVSGIIEGEPYPYYSDYSDLSAAGLDADANRVKHANDISTTWWIRTPHSGYGDGVRYVGTSGALRSSGAGTSRGAAPACNII